ncbi:hypothetical protein [Amycolatopsis sp. Hca4]|uniref:hypothetical protein n=1 Tax=Amycolatopsis sp. Hca4 TaxID=2742131 RepID=UPI001590BEEF|nr:hypothetical protein [Amycolatopsis sp. Hca4]QKV80413.1 hypothetical protein HUT10_46495 [Amycolatopsis sp. Hca4]
MTTPDTDEPTSGRPRGRVGDPGYDRPGRPDGERPRPDVGGVTRFRRGFRPQGVQTVHIGRWTYGG